MRFTPPIYSVGGWFCPPPTQIEGVNTNRFCTIALRRPVGDRTRRSLPRSTVISILAEDAKEQRYRSRPHPSSREGEDLDRTRTNGRWTTQTHHLPSQLVKSGRSRLRCCRAVLRPRMFVLTAGSLPCLLTVTDDQANQCRWVKLVDSMRSVFVFYTPSYKRLG